MPRHTARTPPPRSVLLLLAVVLVAAAQPTAAQTCGSIDALGAGRASGKGVTNDAPALAAMDNNPATGLIYLPKGRYRIATSLTLAKPILGDQGAILQVDSGATLKLKAQPEYGLWRLFDVRGAWDVPFRNTA
jgi:hypothetical protein